MNNLNLLLNRNLQQKNGLPPEPVQHKHNKLLQQNVTNLPQPPTTYSMTNINAYTQVNYSHQSVITSNCYNQNRNIVLPTKLDFTPRYFPNPKNGTVSIYPNSDPCTNVRKPSYFDTVNTNPNNSDGRTPKQINGFSNHTNLTRGNSNAPERAKVLPNFYNESQNQERNLNQVNGFNNYNSNLIRVNSKAPERAKVPPNFYDEFPVLPLNLTKNQVRPERSTCIYQPTSTTIDSTAILKDRQEYNDRNETAHSNNGIQIKSNNVVPNPGYQNALEMYYGKHLVNNKNFNKSSTKSDIVNTKPKRQYRRKSTAANNTIVDLLTKPANFSDGVVPNGNNFSIPHTNVNGNNSEADFSKASAPVPSTQNDNFLPPVTSNDSSSEITESYINNYISRLSESYVRELIQLINKQYSSDLFSNKNTVTPNPIEPIVTIIEKPKPSNDNISYKYPSDQSENHNVNKSTSVDQLNNRSTDNIVLISEDTVDYNQSNTSNVIKNNTSPNNVTKTFSEDTQCENPSSELSDFIIKYHECDKTSESCPSGNGDIIEIVDLTLDEDSFNNCNENDDYINCDDNNKSDNKENENMEDTSAKNNVYVSVDLNQSSVDNQSCEEEKYIQCNNISSQISKVVYPLKSMPSLFDFDIEASEQNFNNDDDKNTNDNCIKQVDKECESVQESNNFNRCDEVMSMNNTVENGKMDTCESSDELRSDVSASGELEQIIEEIEGLMETEQIPEKSKISHIANWLLNNKNYETNDSKDDSQSALLAINSAAKDIKEKIKVFDDLNDISDDLECHICKIKFNNPTDVTTHILNGQHKHLKRFNKGCLFETQASDRRNERVIKINDDGEANLPQSVKDFSLLLLREVLIRENKREMKNSKKKSLLNFKKSSGAEMKKINKDISKPDHEMKCSSCEMRFTSKSDYNEHLLVHNLKKDGPPVIESHTVSNSKRKFSKKGRKLKFRFSCVKCKAYFTTKSGYNKHLVFHIWKKKGLDSVNGHQTLNYKRISSKLNEKLKSKIKCLICNGYFVRKLDYEKHLSYHNIKKSGPYVIKKFIRSNSNRKNNVFDPELKCLLCEAYFVTVTDLNKHKEVHNTIDDDFDTTETHPEPDPKFTVQKKKEKSQHARIETSFKHLKKNGIGMHLKKIGECMFCKKPFSTKETLHFHQTRCPHKDELPFYFCKGCKTAFKTNTKLTDHIKDCRGNGDKEPRSDPLYIDNKTEFSDGLSNK